MQKLIQHNHVPLRITPLIAACVVMIASISGTSKQSIACQFDSPSIPQTPVQSPPLSTEQTPASLNPNAIGSQQNSISDLVEIAKNPTNPEQLNKTISFFISVGALSLAPALLLMSTSFIRIVVVLGILKQALGTQNLPPTQVIMALSLFMTFLLMAPVWNEVKKEAIDPYVNSSSEQSDEAIDWDTAWERGSAPVRKFMSRQIDIANNSDDVWMFYSYLPEEERQTKLESYDDVPLKVLLPAFVVSELKVAFLIGVQIYLPFLILDIVISSVTVSMGMMMLPPTMVSLPFKLLLFVMVDGWSLIVEMLMNSFAPFS